MRHRWMEVRLQRGCRALDSLRCPAFQERFARAISVRSYASPSRPNARALRPAHVFCFAQDKTTSASMGRGISARARILDSWLRVTGHSPGDDPEATPVLVQPSFEILPVVEPPSPDLDGGDFRAHAVLPRRERDAQDGCRLTRRERRPLRLVFFTGRSGGAGAHAAWDPARPGRAH